MVILKRTIWLGPALLIVVACAGCPQGSTPTVLFSADVRMGEADLDVEFAAEPDPADMQLVSWSWDFGDGGTSTQEQPTHTYTEPGLYEVSLTAETDKGKTYSRSRKGYIVVLDPDREVGEEAGEIRTFAGMDFVWIPPGEFTMGSPNEHDWDADARPRHEVRITRGFWMTRTEITQQQAIDIAGYNPSYFGLPEEIGSDAQFPVEQVSWEDCLAFVQILNDQYDGVFRLPTEAEWEYACRAGTTTDYWFGSEPLDLLSHGFFWINAGFQTELVAVSEEFMNPWGLYDMHGNVWEWCLDVYDPPVIDSSDLEDEEDKALTKRTGPSYYQMCADYTDQNREPYPDPMGLHNGYRRVVRSGSWRDAAHVVTSHSRQGYGPTTRYNFIGFRIVRQ